VSARANLIVFQSDNHNRDLPGCYGHPTIKTPNAGYLGLVTHLYGQIGSVMDCATGLNLMDNTRVMYTSDHGETRPDPNAPTWGRNQLRAN